ncbi:hypothetical protein BDP55DRAFT_321789 [Colletotrichum godetiae]|uniref:Nephrocystin 3-like N-terminal domain-containing protein n=1 Tax=Colletotrichum godetiae TaxID=1209918 RepID=A0AAJ0ABW1_9PEZI|nr:uncharacterized protein BDP55DRAFT_321789 [Colletotrichum godetiae]KAK1671055.1 hypothetical protein BDP55DRAFT_321789 [Colletotrichum godetiae]
MPQTGADILDAAVEVYRRFEEKAFASQSLTLDETKALIHRLLLDSYQGQTITLIIDALDECDRETRQDLLDFLVSLVITPTTMKVFVSSRDDRDIVHELQKYGNLHLSSERNSGDIDLYVRLETCRLVSKGSLLRGSSRKEELRNKIIFELTANAHGMFRWASLHIQELYRQATDAAIEERLAKMPRTLEGLYQEILAKIETRDAVADREVARKAFRWLLCAQEQFKSDVFLAMVSGAKDVSTATISRDQLLELCNNMVLFDETLDAFRFSHLSVREFFEGEHAYQITTAHALAAEQCLLNLDDIPSVIMPLTPVMRYSFSFWAHHAKYADHEERQSRLSLILTKFFSGEGNHSSPFSRWHDRLSCKRYDADLDEKHEFNAALSYMPFAMLVICVFDLSGVLSPERWTQLARARPRNLNGATHDELIIRYDSIQILQWQFDVGVAFNWTLKHVKIAAGSMRNSVRVMSFLLERLASDIRVTEEVVQTAASNLVCGDIILSHLLEKRGREINITGDIIKAAVRNSRRGVESTSLLLKHYKSQITPEIVSAAIQNRADVVKLLLDERGDEIEISADMILAAATDTLRLDKSVLPLLLDTRRGQINITKEFLMSIASSRNCDKDLMEMLLEVCEDEVKITAELFDAVGKNPRHRIEVMMLLLGRFGTKSQIPTNFMENVVHRFSGTIVRKFIETHGDALEVNTKIFKAAVQNHHHGGNVAAVLLEEYGDDIKITEDIMEAIFDNQYCGDKIMGVFLDKYPHEIRITEKFVKMAAASRCSGMMALILNKCGEKVCITDELIASCYSATGIQAIITRRKEYKLQVTEHVLIQAARQGKGRRTRRTGDLLLPLLLEWRLEEVRHRLTEDIVIAAANNPSNGVRFITLLIDKCGDDIVITTSVLQAAASNTRCGDRLVAVLLERYGDSIRITESIVEAAVKITGVGGKVMKLLFAARGDRIPIPEKVLVHTCANCFTYEIIQMLLDRRGDHIQITEKAVGVAVQNPWCGTEILELFLERYADGVPLTEEIISLAAGNERCGDKIMSLLLKERDNIPITGAVLFAAAHNSTSGHRVMAVIIDTLGKLDEKNHQLSTALGEALYEASRLGHEETVGVLLDNNADALAQGGLENNALYAASLGGYSKVVQMLLQHNANVNTQGGQFGNALQAASFRGHYKTAELLLENGADPSCDSGYFGGSTQAAAAGGHDEILSLLHGKYSVCLDSRNSQFGRTALSYAAGGGHSSVVQLLLADPNVSPWSIDPLGRTPLFFAAQNGHAEAVSTLAERDPSVVDWKDRYGSTALSVAARRGHVEVVRNLLDTYEVDINSRDCFGRIPLSWARRRGLADVSLLLETAKNGNLSREDFFLGDTDSQLSYEHAASGTPLDLVCDICTLSIPENDTCYHCSDCNGGDFDMCKDCFDNCGSCLVASHELTRMLAE